MERIFNLLKKDIQGELSSKDVKYMEEHIPEWSEEIQKVKSYFEEMI